MNESSTFIKKKLSSISWPENMAIYINILAASQQVAEGMQFPMQTTSVVRYQLVLINKLNICMNASSMQLK
jgi:hypothetical protein